MNVVIQEGKKITKIIVQNLEDKKDVQTLLEGITSKKELEISFFNIKILPKNIVLKLQENRKNIKIFTNESMLKNYLMNLGFDLQYRDNYKNKKSTNLNLEYLALGGSAGSLEKFIAIVSALPASDISIFIIMHQMSDKQSNLSKVLQKQTTHYKVVEAHSDMQIQPSTIYTIPANKHMIVASGFIFLTDSQKRNFSRPSISTTFESLSNEYKSSLLCVLVCGYGSDGSDALKQLEQNQTTVIVEEEDECEAKMMLQNAINTGHYNHIYSIGEINKFINNHINKKFYTHEELVKFLEKVNEKYGYDYRGYSLSHIKRRVNLFYTRIAPSDFNQFEEMVLEDINIFKDLFLNISVNVTTFFRNPEVYKNLRDKILPKLDSFLDIRIWCAGCSSGEEPYSVAIFLKELGLYEKSTIYATDINQEILELAKNGLYPKEDFNRFLKHYYEAGGDESFSSYFHDHGNFVEITDAIKENILFFKHNLVKCGKINDFQLIFCRNVMIYFESDLKMKVFDLFHDSMDSYSFLVLGESESLNEHLKFDTVDEKNKIYKRKI